MLHVEAPGAGLNAIAPISIVVVEPEPVVREGISLFLETQLDFSVVAQAGTVDEAIGAIEQVGGSNGLIVLLGLELIRDDGWTCLRRIRGRYPSVVPVLMGIEADSATVARALSEGAQGYIRKLASPVDFLGALRRVSGGDVAVVGPTPAASGTDRASGQVDPCLTRREREVLSLAARELTAHQIGRRLGISERTVTTHLSNIYKKLGVQGRSGAVRAGLERGLLTDA